jgi:acyl phosphate:glycerol-3-phosphate acyltransferase
MLPLLGVLGAYLLGSVPFAYLGGRLLKGIDLRQHGSGNLGASNVYRTLGAPAAVGVLLADAAKGAIPVLWFPALTGARRPDVWAIGFGIAAILGHLRSVFLLWRGGGKGVATAAGAFAALAPASFVIALAVFLLVVGATRIISLGSICAALALPVGVALTRGVDEPLFVVSLCVAGLVAWTHRENIARLRRGTEPRLGRKVST